MNNRNLRSLNVGYGKLGDGNFGLDLRGRLRDLRRWDLGHGKLRSLDLGDRKLSSGKQFGLDRGHGKLRRLHLRGRYLGHVRRWDLRYRKLRSWNLRDRKLSAGN